jgi:uncharacterized protein YhbP (UPF0306 family)
MELKQLIQDYFRACQVMQLATVRGGMPWICSVHFVTDENMNMYWTSSKARQHSKEIMDDSRVAVAIVKDAERKQGMQIVGTAAMVSLEDAARVDALYGARFGNGSNRLEEVMENDPNGRAYWVIKPTTISLWDEVNFPNSPKQEFILT